MKRRNCVEILCFFILLTICQPVFSSTSVWKVSNGKDFLFIGGTIHLLAQSDFPLPEPFEKAYLQSKVIYLEADLSKTQSPTYQQHILKALTYAPEKNLADFLQPETFSLLQSYCNNLNLPLQQMLAFKPGMLSITLTTLEMRRLQLTEKGVDLYFNQKALNDNKKLGFFETIDQQLALIASLGEGNEDEFIRYLIQDIGNTEKNLNELKHAWRLGDSKKMAELGLSPLSGFEFDFQVPFITERNRTWIPQIENLFENNEVEFVLVGALHLVGQDGVLQLLSEKGYHIEQL